MYSGYKYFFRYSCCKYFLVILLISHRKNIWKVWSRSDISIDSGVSLVVQWLRVHQPMQGTQVQFLVWEDPMCCWSIKLVLHNNWAHMPQLLKPACPRPLQLLKPACPRPLQLLKPACLRPLLCNEKSYHSEEPSQWYNREPTQQWRPRAAEINK